MIASLVAGLAVRAWPVESPRSGGAGSQPGGTALGMSAAQIRGRMAEVPGVWATTRAGPIQVLTWRGDAAREIRFELHDGLLTAVRAVLDPRDAAARGARVELTPLLVTTRRPRADGLVDYVALVRDCSAHAGEVAAILRDAASP